MVLTSRSSGRVACKVCSFDLLGRGNCVSYVQAYEDLVRYRKRVYFMLGRNELLGVARRLEVKQEDLVGDLGST